VSNNAAAHGCRLLEWDTRFFARRIAQCVPPPDAAPDGPGIAGWCREHAVDCLYLLCPAADAALARFAGENHFQLVDIRLTLERPLDAALPALEPTPAVLRPAGAADLPALQAIARTSHRNTRFFRDGRFPPALCEKLYETWIANSLADPATAVWLAEVAGQTAGYVTADGRGHIGLLAVDAAHRRLGLGRHLVRQALALFRERDLATVQVVTQGGCVGPQRLYQQCGFVTAEVGLWYHKWFV
jgi:ribosomal protein S18 acetylase RimI-like enzyme